MMRDSEPPTRYAVLDYHRPSGHQDCPPGRAWAVRTVGVLPFLLVLGTVFHETVFGDPPESLTHFKAYHYVVWAALVTVTTWVVWVAFEVHHGRARRLALFVAVVWCIFVWLFGAAFLDSLNEEPMGVYYRAQWDGQ